MRLLLDFGIENVVFDHRARLLVRTVDSYRCPLEKGGVPYNFGFLKKEECWF